MIAALGMLKSLQRQTEEEITRLRQQSQAMENALRLLTVKAKVLRPAKVRRGHISAQGLKRIKQAQQARWAAYHKQQAQLAKGRKEA